MKGLVCDPCGEGKGCKPEFLWRNKDSFTGWGQCPSLSSTEAVLGVITEAVFEGILGEVTNLVALLEQERID